MHELRCERDYSVNCMSVAGMRSFCRAFSTPAIRTAILLFTLIVFSATVNTTSVWATYVDEVLNSAPTVYWQLDDLTAGVGGAADSSASGTNVGNHTFPNGTVGVAGFPLFDVTGNLAAEFVNGDVISNSGAAFDVPETGAFSIEMFFRPNSQGAPQFQELAAKGPAGGNQSWYLLHFGPGQGLGPAGGLRFGVNGSGSPGQFVDSVSTIPYDQWSHIVATYDTDPGSLEASLYINGQLNITTTLDPPGALSPGENFVVGGIEAPGLVNTANGTFDEVAYYAKALSATEVQNHYIAAFAPSVGELLIWNREDGGSWLADANWTLGSAGTATIPNSERAIARFGDRITSDSTVFVDQNVTVNTIEFDHFNSYVVAGSKTVSLLAGTSLGDPSIHVQQGSHQFQAIVSLLNKHDCRHCQ